MDSAKPYQMVQMFCIVASGEGVRVPNLYPAADPVTGSVTNFFPTVVATLGYNDINSLLLTAPPYVSCSELPVSFVNY